MSRRKYYLYRLDIVYPVGSHDENGWPVPGWRPADWPDERFIDRYTGTFRWPRQKTFRSAMGAERRADLFRDYGCIVRVVRSKAVEWDEELPPYRDESTRTKKAIKVMTKILQETAE